MLVSKAERKTDRKVAKAAPGQEPDANIGQALRTVYEETIDEAIPQEMLDLLGKLN
jgi:hypothetical protein